MSSGASQIRALVEATAGEAVGVTLQCRPLQACNMPPVICGSGYNVWSLLSRWR